MQIVKMLQKIWYYSDFKWMSYDSLKNFINLIFGKFILTMIVSVNLVKYGSFMLIFVLLSHPLYIFYWLIFYLVKHGLTSRGILYSKIPLMSIYFTPSCFCKST